MHFFQSTFQQASDGDKWTYSSSEIDHGGIYESLFKIN